SHTFFFPCYVDHRDLHSFPTRRSSDLRRLRHHPDAQRLQTLENDPGIERGDARPRRAQELEDLVHHHLAADDRTPQHTTLSVERSEEHTSELQSRENLVWRLLLEKKNN